MNYSSHIFADIFSVQSTAVIFSVMRSSKTPDRSANTLNADHFIICIITRAMIKNKCCFQPMRRYSVMFKDDSWAVSNRCVGSKVNRTAEI